MIPNFHSAHQQRALPYVCLAILFLLSSCSGNSSGAIDEAVSQNQGVETRITGTVVEQISGEPVRDAIIITDPPTEVVRTDGNGVFNIKDGVNGSGNYQVFVEHYAYNKAQGTVSVVGNGSSQIDFILQSSIIGLHASRTQIEIKGDQNRESLRLTSNVQNTSFSIQATDPWVRATPAKGQITNRETAIIEIQIDRAQLPDQAVTSSELVINPDNGTRVLVINLTIRRPLQEKQVNERQLDCRRPDIYRVAWDWPDGSLIQFPESILLPENTGPRNFQIINPLLVDSFVLSELGTVTISHVGGTTPASTLDIFELDKDENIKTLATNFGVNEENKRASITHAMLPGVYCYVLRPTTGFFANPEIINLEIGFTPAQ